MRLRSQRIVGDELLVVKEEQQQVPSAIESSLQQPQQTQQQIYKRRLRSATKKDRDVPELRRAGSSTFSSSAVTYLSFDNEEEDEDYFLVAEDTSSSSTTTTKSRSACKTTISPDAVWSSSTPSRDNDDVVVVSTTTILSSSGGGKTNALYRMTVLQLECLFRDFHWNGLPWEGMQCRSVKAGLTGIFFALPAILTPTMHPLEQCWWILQATTSILADYIYVHTRSAWHGIDRVVAQLSLLGMLMRSIFYVHPIAIVLLVSSAVACFVAASKAKDANDLERWHWMHCLWHINAPLSTVIGVYLSHLCPTGDIQDFLQPACRV
eukprot:scaffold504_cov109-Cylindrotheca_fusiformis.AAC.15